MISNRLSVRTFRWSASLLSKKAETSKNASTTKKTQKDAIEKSTEEKPKKTVKSKKKVTEEKENIRFAPFITFFILKQSSCHLYRLFKPLIFIN